MVRLLKFPSIASLASGRKILGVTKITDNTPVRTVKPQDVPMADLDKTDATTVDLYNAKSWNKETHPDGIGDSYWIAAVHWDPDNKLLIRFRDGYKAKYDVDSDTAKQLVKADSKGRFVYRNIKDLPYTEYKGSLV